MLFTVSQYIKQNILIIITTAENQSYHNRRTKTEQSFELHDSEHVQ